ncbi:hypothetical protein HYH03_008092 [Edaphochlamys debaryana]|uniref:Sulfotransferase n=1 Tax=Edaphochlamys debaryana TaxID=47281 RepID=A0A836BZM9_9CHLO|nr:hypothetical protein HYH03_008092 [Edaphochlamys debaryana]|eukprot:KAG2493573.1 hypothetical protein HYH03_008092 [Edaphochlamys debaryana]
MCDKHLEPYQREAATWRLRLNRTDILIGDWSASYFSCICCPPLLKTLNPDIKIIVMLRDPVDRALSRFVEQKRVPNGPFRKQVENSTFAEWAATELVSLRDCISRAERFRGPAPAGAGPFTGWGAGWTLGEWMEAQCLARSNLLGWSAYSVFLGNWLAHIPPERLLVLYTVDLSADPLAVLRRVEAFLGVRQHTYDPQRLGLVFNARDCYNWRCSKPQKEVGPVDKADGAAAGGHEGPFKQAHAELVRFFRPYMQRLFSWADEGKIAQVPPAWRTTYA